MPAKKMTRRQQKRMQAAFPAGMFMALLTFALVTLLGVAMRFDSWVIVQRACFSALVLGIVVSLGVNVIRLAESENKTKRAKQ